MAFEWNKDGPTWQPVDPETATESLQVFDDAGGLVTDKMLEVIKAQVRSGALRVVADSWGRVMIAPEAEIGEMIAQHERRGFWDGGEDE